MRMTLVRTITISGFSADANPNVTAPPAAQVIDLEALAAAAGDQTIDERVEGLRMCMRAIDNSNVEQPNVTADFRLWQRDAGASDSAANGGLAREAYIALRAEAAAPSSGSYACALKSGKAFVQVTAIGTVGSATKLQIWAEAATSVPG
jgi:hypothetical protein